MRHLFLRSGDAILLRSSFNSNKQEASWREVRSCQGGSLQRSTLHNFTSTSRKYPNFEGIQGSPCKMSFFLIFILNCYCWSIYTYTYVKEIRRSLHARFVLVQDAMHLRVRNWPKSNRGSKSQPVHSLDRFSVFLNSQS